jgi:endoglucanase
MVLRSSRRVVALLCTATVAAATAAITIVITAGPAAAATFNYGEALQKSFLFYEAQVSGHKEPWNRVSWRGDSTVNDGKGPGGSPTLDLSGGWYDAGDHVKFGFPMAAAVSTLAWGGVDYRAAYQQSGQLTALLNNLHHANDYFIAAHPDPNTLYVQVGDGTTDHNYWGAPETVEAKGISRPVYKITASCPGTDVAAETAAAMAASSMVFRPTDPTYADTLLTHARQLFTFADTTKGTNGQDTAYVNCVTAARNFYNSTGEGGQTAGATKMYWDELAWAAVWLNRATGEANYLTRAREFYPKMGSEDDPNGAGVKVPVFSFGFGWNDKEYAVYALMAKLTGEAQFKTDVQRYLDYWTVGYKGRKGQITPGGLAFIFFWASLRMAANTAFVALDYADFLGTSDPLYARYHDFGKRQIDYALGDNPRAGSYMVGFGAASPRNIHHRGAHGSWVDAGPGGTPTVSRHVLTGALVGGPDASDSWADDRGDFVKNEVALDYNSGITSSLVRLYSEFGGNPLATIPQETPDGPEIVLERGSIQQQTGSTTVQTFLVNKSAWPARVLNAASFRYYFTLDGATTPSQISVSSPFTNCRPPTGPTQVSGGTYYVTVDCTGTLSFPGGQSEFRREAQIVIRSTGSWDPSNDWSASSVNNMTLYGNAGQLIFGTPPGGPPPVDGTPPTTPGAPTIASQTATTATLSWAASTDNVGVVAYDLVRVTGSTEMLVSSPTTTTATVNRPPSDVVETYAVYARDAAGNRSARSGSVLVTGTPANTAPTQPGTPVASNVTATSITLNWTASTDNVGVVGYDVVRIDLAAETIVATPTTNTVTLTGLASGQVYQFAVYARDTSGLRSTRSGIVIVATIPPNSSTTTSIPPPPPSTSTCRVAYTTNDWSTGFTANLTITNTGTTAITSWTLRFAFPGGQTIAQGWSATWTQSGANVTATNLSWNGTLAPGASTQIGFNGNHNGTNPRPTSFTLNNVTCTVG